MKVIISLLAMLLISAVSFTTARAQQTGNQQTSGYTNDVTQQSQSGVIQYTEDQKTVFAIPYIKELFDEIAKLRTRLATCSGDTYERVKKEHDKYLAEYILQLERQQPVYSKDAKMQNAIQAELDRARAIVKK